jgi:hypothetical protein
MRLMLSLALFLLAHTILSGLTSLLPVAQLFLNPVREPSNNGNSSGVFASLKPDYDGYFFHRTYHFHSSSLTQELLKSGLPAVAPCAESARPVS